MEPSPKQKYRDFEKSYLDPVEIEKFLETYLGYVPIDEVIREYMVEMIDLIPPSVSALVPKGTFSQIFEARAIYKDDPILLLHHTMMTPQDMIYFGFLKGAFKF